jgi:hypothetical protein
MYTAIELLVPWHGCKVAGMSLASRSTRSPRDMGQARSMANDDRETRYSHSSGSGGNESKRHERKEERPDSQPRHGGDHTPDESARKGRPPRPPIEPEEREKVR